MESEEHDDLIKAKKQFKIAQDNLFNEYLEKIIDTYNNLKDVKQLEAIRGLEFLIEQIQQGGNISKPLFDHNKATEMRKKAGFSLSQLAKKFNLSESTISMYESGTGNLTTIRRGTKKEKYFLWLKDQGYNPLNI